ncbi:putative ribonuclease H-like domain-containing protein [Tanacetum coccineum]|uniref:Ribonuclease H-like domain-containing protein n=1 Tax=Tanacetum coccineum TaxID=301880 RepID=A0ABQ4Y605_9ASTR
MFAAIETRFGWLKQLPRKTQKTLLKQQYEYFCAQSAEVLDSIFIRLKKIVIVWKNKPEIKTMSIDDLYNNFKIVEQKIKKTVGTSSGGQNLAFTTAPNSSSTNDANTAYSQVSAALVLILPVHKFALQVLVIILLFICLSWDTLPESAEHQEARKISSEIKTTPGSKETKKTLPRQYSEVYTDKTCSKTCLNNYETLKKQYDDLLAKLLQTKFEGSTYKRGLDTVEAQLVTYRKNEVLFSEEVAVLKREVGIKQYEINMLKTEASHNMMFKRILYDSGRLEAHDWVHIAHLSDLQRSLMRGYVAFGGGAFGVKFLVNDTECLVLSPNFKLPDENQILLKVSRKNNMYSFDMKNIVPKDILTCLIAKATLDESMLWHKRLEIENLVDKKVKIIRSDNGTEFKNKVKDDFCREKGIKREYSVARTPQQNGVAERRNRTLIEAARRMLADPKLPTTF